MPVALAKKINRFEIERVLGSGAQGTVYLARDTRLARQVAIKTPVVGGKADEHRRRVDALLAEARTVGQLSHPNVVPLFDAGEENGVPFLVFEYVEGTVLSQLLKRGKLEPRRAAGIALELLAGLGYAHGKGVVHRDVKPGNVMLTTAGKARLMDFGIAQPAAAATPDAPDGLRGTPLYLAPEYIDSGIYTPQCDVFSAGMVLYEMLAGRTAVDGANVFQILHRLANERLQPPSTHNPAVDEKLDDIVMKALAAQPVQRYADAASMEKALRGYLDPDAGAEGAPAAEGGGTLEFLLRRMRLKSDFPALSNTISTINRVTGSDDEGAAALSNTILKDFALTNKLLRLVNTAYYGQYGGTISTVSRAVVILGFDRIRSVAMTLMLMEHLQNKAQASKLKEDVVAGYFSGLLARELVARAGIRDGEEAFICTMFHDFGRLLARFYLPEEAEEIEHLVAQGDMDEQQASIKVLGMSFEALGIGVARAWNFPERMVQSMRKLPEEQIRRPATGEERLRALAELGVGLCAGLREPDPAVRARRMRGLVDKFGKGLGVTPQILEAAVQQSVQALERDAPVLDLRAASGLIAAASAMAKETTGDGAPEDQLQTVIDNATLATGTDNPADTAMAEEQAPDAARKAVLTAGIQDITASLAGDYKLNDLLRIILETMYRGMGFTRVLLCVREPAGNVLRGRFGFGARIDEVLQKGFAIPIGGARDVFQASIASGADVLIDDVDADNIRAHIPDWFRKCMPARSFALFPIMVNKKPIGMLYGDADAAGRLRFAPDELALLKTLRNQAVLAIKQQSG